MSHTITHIRLSVLGVLCALYFTATPTYAYFTTGQNAETLTGGALFTIDYTFGMTKHDVLMPFFAHEQGVAPSTDAVSYTILDEDNLAVPGKASAIILSTATLEKNGVYRVVKGGAKKFTLAVVFAPETPNPEKTYRLQVTNLPFNFDGTQQLQLNPSELKYYTTKSISM
jgi:hypothetical protein